MGTIVLNELDSKFKYDVAEQPGGENIKVCFSCGLCTAGCPVSEIDENYNPRKIIHMVLLGMRQQVLSSDFIWLCSLCYTCYAHCPQNVNFTDVMRALRVMAVKEGYVHPSFPDRIKEIDSLSQKLRHQMALSILSGKSEASEIDPVELLNKTLQKMEKAKAPTP